MKPIHIHPISHNGQRYNTVGDWYYTKDEGRIIINVSMMSDDRYEFLVALHELIEAKLCEHRGIKQEDVDTFDQLFEHERGVGKHLPEAEPGDDPRAPYYQEHQIATVIEKQMAHWLEVDWILYEGEIASL